MSTMGGICHRAFVDSQSLLKIFILRQLKRYRPVRIKYNAGYALPYKKAFQ